MPVSSNPPTPGRALDLSTTPANGDVSVDLAAWLQHTREQERAALARELHDELGAILTAARLDVAWLAAQPACHDPAIAQRLDALRRLLAQGITFKRRVVEDLHPTVLTHLGLAPALEQLAAAHRQRFDGRLHVDIDDSVTLSGEPALALYRIVQESLTNVQKYAQADRVEVTLRRVRGRVELGIRDDGRGFDAAAVGRGHHGLAGMRHRMDALGGRFEVRTAPGEGTTIRASLPATGRRPDAQVRAPAPRRAPAARRAPELHAIPELRA